MRGQDIRYNVFGIVLGISLTLICVNILGYVSECGQAHKCRHLGDDPSVSRSSPTDDYQQGEKFVEDEITSRELFKTIILTGAYKNQSFAAAASKTWGARVNSLTFYYPKASHQHVHTWENTQLHQAISLSGKTMFATSSLP